MSVRIVAEIGSTHLARMDLIKAGIEALAEQGVDSVKFQLFPNEDKYTKSGNIYLSPDLFYNAVAFARSCGMDISASVFDEDALDLLLSAQPKWVKFAYSKKEDVISMKRVMLEGLEAIVSCDVMSVDSVPKNATKLFCLPLYPVYFNPRFEEIFPRFDGFSDHTLGYDVTLDAVRMGAKVIEKHVKFADIGCPDCAFALNIRDFGEMTRKIRAL